MTLRILALSLVLAASASAEAPRLAVLISVDQMRADYLSDLAPEFTGGFARLAKEGAVFSAARHGHVPTETAPGHAALSTGRYPREHGIMANDWFDYKAGKFVYCVSDPEVGVSPRNLLVPALGDALQEAHPKAKVYSVAGKDRVAVLLGGRKADAALWYDRKRGVFTTSEYYKTPAWLASWNGANEVEAAMRKPVIVTTRYDRLILSLARRALAEARLGADETTDLLAVGLSATDYLGHLRGPQDPSMRVHLLELDKELGKFLEFLDRKVGRGRYTVALSADHGVLTMPESPEGKAMGLKRVMGDAMAKELNAALSATLKAPGDWVRSVYPPNIYLDLPAAEKAGLAREAFIEAAAKALSARPEIAQVYRAADLRGESGDELPYIAEYRRGWRADRGGQLMILVKPDVLLADDPVETTHSQPYDHDARVPLILAGSGVRPGRYDGPVLAEDLAPTLAKIVDARLEPSEGCRVLEEALAPALPPVLPGQGAPERIGVKEGSKAIR